MSNCFTTKTAEDANKKKKEKRTKRKHASEIAHSFKRKYNARRLFKDTQGVDDIIHKDINREGNDWDYHGPITEKEYILADMDPSTVYAYFKPTHKKDPSAYSYFAPGSAGGPFKPSDALKHAYRTASGASNNRKEVKPFQSMQPEKNNKKVKRIKASNKMKRMSKGERAKMIQRLVLQK